LETLYLKTMIKLTNILKEIKIRNVNKPDLSTNEGLCDFLNQNIKELIKKEEITDDENNEDAAYFIDNVNDLQLKLGGGEDGNEIIWNDEIGISYHWFCPEEDLSDGGSFEWEEDELNGAEFWSIRYNI